jgi:hypothetical protein
MLNGFRIARYRFHLRFLEDAWLPAYKGAVLRGAFGYAFRNMACARRGEERFQCPDCPLRTTCPYVYVFETQPGASDKSPLEVEDAPRPFVFDVPLDGERRFRAGDTLPFDLLLIGNGIRYLPYFALAFEELGRVGIGNRDRARYQLAGVDAVDSTSGRTEGVYHGGVLSGSVDLSRTFADLSRDAQPPDGRAVVRFATPTRLKVGGQYVERPEFHALARVLLRRISMLSATHCGEVWEADFRALVDQAANVKVKWSDTRWHDWSRYSTRQRQEIDAGGIVGKVCYAGDLTPFASLLRLGSLIHVGKMCVFGHGKYEVHFGLDEGPRGPSTGAEI